MSLVVDDVADTEDFFEMSLDNLCVTGFDGYFKRVNGSWTRTLGWTAKELLSSPVLDFVHPDDRDATLAGRARLHNGSQMGPLTNRYRCKDGSYKWLEWRSVAHHDRALVYAAARDVTEQKLAEQSLAQAKVREEALQRQLTFADRMASIGTLAGGVAHEINNPLASVVANVGLILEALDAAPARLPELREMAVAARDGAERIRKVVLGMRTFSRAEGDPRTVLDLRAVLALAADMTANEIRHRARLVTDFGETPRIEGDEARVAQVFINLLVNATQAIPEGRRDANEIRIVTSTDEAGFAVVEIRDSGVGIAPEVLSRIFDPFFTTKPVGVGTGLGLSICHTIVAGMGGDIRVASEPGRGTTFRVVLPPAVAAPREPVAAVEAPRELAAPPPPHVDAARAAVLVVDDEPAIGVVLRRLLHGHEVTVVHAARDALALLESGERFDVVLSDLTMPEMTGMDFYDELTRRFPDVVRRVVFISGGAFTPRASAFLQRVTNVRLAKPFDAQAVRDLVERFRREP